MAKYRGALPTFGKGIFVSYTGIETDLIFNRGIDLPGFASYPLLETKEGPEMLYDCYARLIDIARQKRVGVLCGVSLPMLPNAVMRNWTSRKSLTKVIPKNSAS